MLRVRSHVYENATALTSQARRPRQREIWLDSRRFDDDEKQLPSSEKPRLLVRLFDVSMTKLMMFRGRP
jgi:hypothetical protein